MLATELLVTRWLWQFYHVGAFLIFDSKISVTKSSNPTSIFFIGENEWIDVGVECWRIGNKFEILVTVFVILVTNMKLTILYLSTFVHHQHTSNQNSVTDIKKLSPTLSRRHQYSRSYHLSCSMLESNIGDRSCYGNLKIFVTKNCTLSVTSVSRH